MKRLLPYRRNQVLLVVIASDRTRSVQPSRCGFTLMETLVALGLCGLIVASVGTSLELYWRFSTLSRERVTASQVQRGVVEDLTSDLRTAVPLAVQNTAPVDSPAALQAARLSSGGAGGEMFLDISEQILSLTSDDRQPVHFFGSADAVAILTEHSNPRFVASNISGYRAIRQQHVVWWLNNGQSIRLPLSAIGPRAESATLIARDVAAGLVRAERPFLPSRNSQRDVPPVLISADVTALQLRYFDGTQWLSEWDSLRQLAIPEAVEVQLTFRDQSASEQRFVIHLPQANRRR